jgi:hypothetical protein
MRLSKIFIAVFAFCPLLAFAQESESIEWSPATRLTWSDYLAKPGSRSDAAAITSTAIGIEYHVRNHSFGYSITCRFSKSRSWGRSKTSYILAHEQGHFDITEIYARILSKELKEYTFNPSTYQRDVSRIYQRVMEEKEAFQNLYDTETDFSRNKDKQVEWITKINDQLEATNDYAGYQATVNL